MRPCGRRLGWACLCAAWLGLSACQSAAPALDALTQAEPDSVRQRAMRRLNLASAYYEQGQSAVALQEARAALQIDPKYADAYSLLGLIHQRNHATVLAQQSFEQALRLASEPPVEPAQRAAIEHNVGWFWCEQNQFAKAQALFESALPQLTLGQAQKTRQAMAFCQARAAAQVAPPSESPAKQ